MLKLENIAVTLKAQPERLFTTAPAYRVYVLFIATKNDEEVDFWVGNANMTAANQLGIKGTNHAGQRGAIEISVLERNLPIDLSGLYIMGDEGKEVIVSIMYAEGLER